MCSSCTIYIVLFGVFFITGICISSVFICFHWYLKKDNVQWYLKKNDVPIKFNSVLKQQFIKCNSIEHINGKY